MLIQHIEEYCFVNGDVHFLCNSNHVYNENKTSCDGFQLLHLRTENYARSGFHHSFLLKNYFDKIIAILL